ncbi:hypothetical protein EDD85DRAFT_837090 [Armillaria nabsnona]|nr:hypothetical protein EDD85DRAFT_837090 [Armillaria nabsnona]
MQQRFTMVPLLLVHLFLVALQYDDSPFQYAILVMRELVVWALPSTVIAILDREIDGAHEDLIEAAEAGRLGRDNSRALWDMFYGLEDSFHVLHEETRLTSRYPWSDTWAMIRCKCVPIYKSLWKVRDFRRQVVVFSISYSCLDVS